MITNPNLSLVSSTLCRSFSPIAIYMKTKEQGSQTRNSGNAFNSNTKQIVAHDWFVFTASRSRVPGIQIKFNSELTSPSLAAPRTRHMIPLHFSHRFSWPSPQSESLESNVQTLGLAATMVILTIPASVAKRKQACTSCRQRKKKCDVRVMMY